MKVIDGGYESEMILEGIIPELFNKDSSEIVEKLEIMFVPDGHLDIFRNLRIVEGSTKGQETIIKIVAESWKQVRAGQTR